MVELVQHLLNGFLIGGIYALMGIGLTLIFGVMNVVNFAHGQFYMLGAFVVYTVFTLASVPQAVHMVDFDVKAGEILSIIGPNGAGKTTILNAITRVGPITDGKISHQGALLNGLRSYEVARCGIGRTFQNTSLFPDVSTRQNLVLAHNGLEPESLLLNLLRSDASVQAAKDAEVAADRILERTRLLPYGASLARSLPYGHQRVLELGIALAARPSLLLLDEPAAGLNPPEVSNLMAMIQQIRHEGVTIVLVEHDMKLVMSVSDRIVVLDHGRKIAEGRPEQVRTNQRVVEAYLGKRS